MSPHELEQLFTKIVQFSPNENQKGGGSGIGLFLSHQIMAGHDLKLHVFSEGVAGRGAQFFIDFPFMPPAEDDQALTRQAGIENHSCEGGSGAGAEVSTAEREELWRCCGVLCYCAAETSPL
jgi:hypothetical protein